MASFHAVSVPTPKAFVFLSTLLAICITHFISIEKNLYSCKFLGFPSNAADVSVLLGCGDSSLDD